MSSGDVSYLHMKYNAVDALTGQASTSSAALSVSGRIWWRGGGREREIRGAWHV